MELIKEHLLDLQKSGITEDFARQNGLYSVKAGEVTRSPVMQDTTNKTWLIFPYQHTPRFFRAKWFPAPLNDKGKQIKYYQEPGSKTHLFLPKWGLELKKFNNLNQTPLFITEGEKKALCASERGLCCVGLGGLWNWKNKGEQSLIEDFDRLNLRGREVYIVPDNDFRLPKHKGQLKRAVKLLAYRLITLGAVVFIKYLPEGSLKGLDDYLVAYNRLDFESLPYEEITLKEPSLDLHEETKQLMDYQGDDAVISSWDFAEILKQEREVKHKAVPTGIGDIDQYLKNGGARPGELVVITGKSGHGKTTFCKTWTYNAVKSKHNVLWLPYEGIEEEFIDSFGDNLPKFYLPKKMTSYKIDWITSKFQESTLKYGKPEIIFVDNLNYLTKGVREDTLKNCIKNIMDKLVELAKQQETIVVLCVNTLKSANSQSHNLDISDIRDASEIIDYAAIIFMIQREDEYSSLYISKNRGLGKTKQIPLYQEGGFLKN